MANLVIVPNFMYDQGDVFDGGEAPIQVLYYNDDLVELKQGDDKVLIRAKDLNKLFREIKKHLPEAQKCLKS